MKKSAYIGLLVIMAVLVILPFVLPNKFYVDLATRMAINAIIVISTSRLPRARAVTSPARRDNHGPHRTLVQRWSEGQVNGRWTGPKWGMQVEIRPRIH